VPSSQYGYASAARPASLWTDSMAGTLRLKRAISRGRGSFRMNGSRTLEGWETERLLADWHRDCSFRHFGEGRNLLG
jgi:hypothetical protein